MTLGLPSRHAGLQVIGYGFLSVAHACYNSYIAASSAETRYLALWFYTNTHKHRHMDQVGAPTSTRTTLLNVWLTGVLILTLSIKLGFAIVRYCMLIMLDVWHTLVLEATSEVSLASVVFAKP